MSSRAKLEAEALAAAVHLIPPSWGQTINLTFREGKLMLGGGSYEASSENSVMGEVSGSGSCAVEGRTFAFFVGRMSGEVEMTFTGESLKLKSGNMGIGMRAAVRSELMVALPDEITFVANGTVLARAIGLGGVAAIREKESQGIARGAVTLRVAQGQLSVGSYCGPKAALATCPVESLVGHEITCSVGAIHADQLAQWAKGREQVRVRIKPQLIGLDDGYSWMAARAVVIEGDPLSYVSAMVGLPEPDAPLALRPQEFSRAINAVSKLADKFGTMEITVANRQAHIHGQGELGEARCQLQTEAAEGALANRRYSAAHLDEVCQALSRWDVEECVFGIRMAGDVRSPASFMAERFECLVAPILRPHEIQAFTAAQEGQPA